MNNQIPVLLETDLSEELKHNELRGMCHLQRRQLCQREQEVCFK